MVTLITLNVIFYASFTAIFCANILTEMPRRESEIHSIMGESLQFGKIEFNTLVSQVNKVRQ